MYNTNTFKLRKQKMVTEDKS